MSSVAPDLPEGTRLLPHADLTDWLAQQVERRRSAALIRFGDGEMRVLRADPGNEASMTAAMRDLESQTGRADSAEAVLEIKAALTSAFDGADVLGILVEEGHRWEHNWLTALYAERLTARGAPAILANCAFHQRLVKTLPELLAGRRVSVVSCRDVKPVLETRWGLEDVRVYQVPSQYTMRDLDGEYEAAMHDVPMWPDAHARVERELTVREPGEVFLVGAGTPGKDLCMQIRERGGVAIDAGAALDRLAGKPSRGLLRGVRVQHRRGMSAAEIVAYFKSRKGVDLDREKVERAVEESEDDPSNELHVLDFYGINLLAARPDQGAAGEADVT